MKILVCGDLHTKFHIFETVREMAKDYDRVVFLGDYVDEWDAIPETSYNLLKALIDYKKQYPKKVILLLGNHDLSEWQGKPFVCSGFNERTHALVASLYDKNASLFDIAYSENDLVFSHAGFVQEWVDKYFPNGFLTTQELADAINQDFHSQLESSLREGLWKYSDVGYERGGYSYPSPLWADEIELTNSPYKDFRQVVGHTPQHEIYKIDEPGKFLVFCDTFSLYPDKRPFGNNNLLEIEGQTFRPIQLTKN